MLAGGVLPPLSPDGREIPRRHRLGPSRERTMDRARIPARGCGGMARSPRYVRSQRGCTNCVAGPAGSPRRIPAKIQNLGFMRDSSVSRPGKRLRGFSRGTTSRLRAFRGSTGVGWVPCASMKCVPIPLTRSTGCVRRWTRWGDAPSRITRLVSHRQGRTAGNRGWSKSFPFRFPENGVSSPPTRPCLLL
jgi:hypothetical protein